MPAFDVVVLAVLFVSAHAVGFVLVLVVSLVVPGLPGWAVSRLVARPWLRHEMARRIRYSNDAVRTARRAHAGFPAGRVPCAA